MLLFSLRAKMHVFFVKSINNFENLKKKIPDLENIKKVLRKNVHFCIPYIMEEKTEK